MDLLGFDPNETRTRPDKPRILGVTSGKGGVGKTQVSANLGVALAAMGAKVLMLDADLGLASLDIALGLKPQHDLTSVVAGQCTMEEIAISGPKGVTLIPACPGRYDMANLSNEERSKLIDDLLDMAASYDILIIDTGAGIGSNAVSFASLAHDILLVTTPDPTSIRDAYAMAKTLHRRAGTQQIRFVANQVNGEEHGAQIHETVDQIVKQFLELDLSYLGCIPKDREVQRAVSQGVPFVLLEPTSRAARAAQAIARRLYSPSHPQEGPGRSN